ncbi:MAG: hypothetical protein GVY08_13140 [Bacteroidetes bacterium]|jgi:uncharacterized iron-regulated membrane protein|nr:hypothetical protein [Bacteroidota bacterium]
MSLISNKTLFKLHGWLGLNLGLILFVICLSGTFATLSNEFDWLANEEMRIEKKDRQANWQKMMDSIEREYPEGVNLGMYKGTYSGNADYFATVAYVYMPNDQTLKVYLNPRTGEIQGQNSFFNTQRFFRTFHRRFFDGNRGIVLITLLSIPMLIIVLAGFLFYKGWLKNLFTLRLDRKKRVQWSDGHKLAGIWSLLFALVIVLTGVFYFSELMVQASENNDLLVMPSPDHVEEDVMARYDSVIELLPMSVYTDSALAALPGLDIRGIRMPKQAGEFVYINGQEGNPLTRDRANHVLLDPATAEVVDVLKSSEMTLLPFITDIADPLHFGYFGGLTTKILWFLFGLIISFSILSGSYLWVIKTVEKAKTPVDGFPWMRGVTISTTIALLYFLWVAVATVDGIRSYGPMPDPVSEPIAEFSIGDWQASSDMTHYFSEPDKTYLELNFQTRGLVNIREVSLLAEPDDAEPFSFESYAQSHYLDLDEEVRDLLNSSETVYLSVDAFNNDDHVLEISSADILSAYRAVVQQKEAIPQPVQREWPQSKPGIWIYIGLFVLLTISIIIIWVRWLLQAMQKQLYAGRKNSETSRSKSIPAAME